MGPFVSQECFFFVSYFLLPRWVSLAAHGHSPVAALGGLQLWSMGSRIRGVSTCCTLALQLWHDGLVAPQHVGSQFPDQGLNLCALYGKANSQPLDPQRSPPFLFLYLLKNVFQQNLFAAAIFKTSTINSSSYHGTLPSFPGFRQVGIVYLQT